MLKRIFFNIVFLCTPLMSDALQFEHLTVADGLSNNMVFCIHQDSLGFMWFGTGDGLDRFDGIEFRVFKHDPFDSTSLSNNSIKCIHEDQHHRLWIGTEYGLNEFDPTIEKFARYFFSSDNPERNFIRCIQPDGDSLLWLGTHDGLIKLNLKTKQQHTFVHRIDTVPTKKNEINSICQLEDGAILLGTSDDHIIYNPKTETFCDFDCRIARDTATPTAGHALTIDRAKNLWIGYSSLGVYRYNQADSSVQTFKHLADSVCVHGNCIFDIQEDRDGIIWIAGISGLNLYDKTTHSFRYHETDVTNPTSINSVLVLCIYQDRQDNIWLGTMDNGVNKLKRWKSVVSVYRKDKNEPESLPHGEVMNICQDRDGNIWHTSFGAGCAKIDADWQNATNLFWTNRRFFRGGFFFGIFEDREGHIWFDTPFTFTRYNWSLQRFESMAHLIPLCQTWYWYRFRVGCADSKNNLWFGGLENGLHCLKNLNEVLEFQYDPDDPASLLDDRIFCIHCDAADTIWVGTIKGLSCLPPGARSFINWRLSMTDSAALRGRTDVLSVFKDNLGTLWIGTDAGLNRRDPKTKRFVDVTTILGHKRLKVGAILQDFHNDIWIRTTAGLYRLDPADNSVRHFDESDGFEGVRGFNQGANAFHLGKRGHIYYGGVSKIARFHPDSLFEKKTPPKIVLTSLTINYKKATPTAKGVLEKAITYKKNVTLSHKDNNLSLTFAALDYKRSLRNTYKFRTKLEGLQNEWMLSGINRRADYTNLPPGIYTFRVTIESNNPAWEESGASLEIFIKPPWWRTGWALFLFAVLIIFSVLTIYRFQLNRARLKQKYEMEREQSQKLQEIDRLKSSFFANISHEFRTPLTLIIGPLEKLRAIAAASAKSHYDIILRNAKRLLTLINQLLDFAKLESENMTLQAGEIDVVHFLKRLVASFMSLAERKNIALKFASSDRAVLCYLDQDKFEKIINNVLSNAFKFTPVGGRVMVSLHKGQCNSESQRQCIFIQIADTGPGMTSEQLSHIFDRFYQVSESHGAEFGGSGIGLALAKELVELHHGYIEVASQQDVGSTFTLSFRLGRDHLQEDEIVSEPVSESIFEPIPVEHVDEGVPVESGHSKIKPTIRIVEDNADLRAYVREFLSDDYNIKEAGNGHEGLNKALAKSPDLIISDVMMPGVDGFELCRRLKTDERTSHIPVILLTARASEKSKLSGLEIGADDYIIKPFNAEEVRVRAKNLVQQRRLLREKFSKKIDVQPSDVTVTSIDERFLKRAINIVEQHMDDPDLNTEKLSRLVGLSRMHFNRKLQALTGQTIALFIRTIRLKRAARLLEEHRGNVAQVAYEVGFSNPSYFSECFQKQFGKRPSQVVKKTENDI
ncbi:response regulator [candidate division KSB1 bacterium]|nr:response regulator [candidate division KSB1 bacterium]RQW03819.1 MAG: response regulator [candidate division KSB1 bacterium]